MPNLSLRTVIAAAIFLTAGVWFATLVPSREIALVMAILLLTVFLFAFEVVRVDVTAVGILVLLGLLGNAHALLGLERALLPASELFQGFASNAVVPSSAS
jgi:hypothetical protein